MSDRFKFWMLNQTPHESVQDWEVRVRQAGNLCEYAALTDEMCLDKFEETIRTEHLRTHLKVDNFPKTMPNVVAEAKALEAAQKASKLIGDSAKKLDEKVN